VNLRLTLIIVNLIAFGTIGVIILWRVFSLRRNPEPKPPQNLTPFLPDEELEGRKLERVLFISLLTTGFIALTLFAYYVFEPSRSESAEDQFLEQSEERGAILFANDQSPEYDPTRSLLCADCHGVDGKGGSTDFTIRSDDPRCDPSAAVTAETPSYCLPVQVTWKAPPLDVALLRYSREQVKDIVTFGRPGTPMPPWGVRSGKGVLNEQGIDDLVNYLESIKVTPEEAKERFTKELEDARAQRPGVSDGQLLFELQCARCHTKNWSFYDPANPVGPPPGPQGGGAFGPNLTGGSTLRQFAGPMGVEDQYDWVANGAPPNEAYGTRGISTGRMPHFADVLSREQIQAIVEYERGL
jgi:mono/diheme cytochrome c family protein/cytochrome c553